MSGMQDEDNDYSGVKGVKLEDLGDDPIALKWALLRVRHRHESAGDADHVPFGQMLKEARVDLDQEVERLKRGETITARYQKPANR